MSYTSKLFPYKKSTMPILPGGEQTYLANELQKIYQAIKSIQAITINVENQPLVSTKAGTPTTSDIPVGTWKVINDTTAGTVGLYANIGGVLKSVILT